MKINRILCMLCFLLASNVATAVPITNLVLSDTSVQVGEQFELDVWIANDVVGEEFLSFGFDLLPVSPLISYSGYTLSLDFADVSFGVQNVSGLAFPGIIDSNILLATLMFDAIDVGVANIEVAGLFDGAFYGLFYEGSGFDIASQTSITIEPAPIIMSSPSAWLFSLTTFLVWLLSRKNAANSHVLA